MKILLFVTLILFIQVCLGLDNGFKLPPLGYNSWNDVGMDVSEKTILDAAHGLVNQGLAKLGWMYVNIDDGWSAMQRDSQGRLVPDATKFPNGMKSLVSTVHQLGLKIGIYTDRGTKTCGGHPGSFGHEKIDAQTFADWGIDYLKEDSCNASDDHETAFEEYGLMRDALNATGRSIYFSLCGWKAWYAPQGAKLGNSWRISDDVTDYASLINAINIDAKLYPFATLGGWNDPDMLLGTEKGVARHLSAEQSRTQFSLWAVLSAPLLIGGRVASLNAWDLETYSNAEVLRISQDKPAVRTQGQRVAGGALGTKSGESRTNVFARTLNDNSVAMIFLKVGTGVQWVVCSAQCLKAVNLFEQNVRVRDVWEHKDYFYEKVIDLRFNITADGGSRTFIVSK